MPKSNVLTVGTSRFYNVDCVNGARENLDDGSVDLIITDPPYGIDGDKLHQHYNRNEDFVVDGYVEVPARKYNEFSHSWIKEAERVLRPGGQIYIVSGYTNLYDILDALRATKLREINHIVWKYNFGVYTTAKYVSSHYHILYYAKPGGKRTFNLECRYGTSEESDDGGSSNYRDREDVWIIPREYKPGREKNKNELPTALLIKMIQYSSNSGDLVCDFFLGGFSTARVAIGLGRRAVGFEVSPSIFKSRSKALESLKSGSLTDSLRVPQLVEIANQGEPWTPADLERLYSRYAEEMRAGAGKGEVVQRLASEFKRGKWSILKALKRRFKDNPYVDDSQPTFFEASS